MLTRLRARAIDGATMLSRYIDARRERDRLRALVDRLTDERDEYAQGVSILACRIDRVQQERDARIPTDIDGAQAWCEARGVTFRCGREWSSQSESLGGGGYAGPCRTSVVSATVGEWLRMKWSASDGDDA